ncbi:MFS transporter [Leptospira perolatii]|uniref:MFS transporter n=1 Tax=Leptospira perolatii TaxID=2023191 RepID=A0A2M9ZLF5_9LEPT|nr:MFS transporter [Leptospira perolatii]PJZ70395.1 MFS transporter [Leptospira perolatii]PJZ72922.1 MFS transporter [Leptospira perolatii]
MIFFAMLPVTMIVPVFKEIVKDRLGGTNYGVAWFQSAAMLGSFIFSPVAGYLSDRLGTRRYLIGGFAILDGILLALLPLAPNLSSLFLIRFLEGGAHIFVIGLLLSSLSDRENDPNSHYFRRGILFGLGGMLLTLGGGVGQGLGFLGNKNPLLPFYLGAIIFVFLGIAALLFLKDWKLVQSPDFSFSGIRAAIRLSPLLMIPFLFHFLDRFTVGYFLSTFNLHLREDLSYTPGQVGLVFSILFLLMSALSYPSAILSRKKGSILFVAIGSLVYGAFQAMTGFVSDQSLLIFSIVGCGIGAGIMYVPAMRLASSLCPSGLTALVMTGFTGFGSFGFLLGPIASVAIERNFTASYGRTTGLEATAFIFGFLEILLVILILPFWRKLVKAEELPHAVEATSRS